MLRQLVCVPIHFYRFALSPFLPRACRFEPSCSAYALEAIQTHNIIKGLGLTIRRICRCHPLNRCSGYDPVPPYKDRPK